MKKIYLLCLGLLVAVFSLSGCSDSGGSSSEAVVAPSATVLPFGIEAMTLPVNNDGTMEIDFTYNNRGQLVEAVVSVEFDYDNDGIPDETETTIYTLDPDRSPAQSFDPVMAKSVGPVVSLAKATGVETNNPLSYFPGAILEVEYTRTGDGLEQAAAAVVEEQIIMTYSYDAMDRLEQVVGMRESLDGQQKLTFNYFYDSAGNLVEVKEVYEKYEGESGWVNTDASETIFTYDDSAHLLRVDRSTFDADENRMILEDRDNYTYGFDDQGQIETIVKQEINYSGGVESSRSEDTHSYTYEASRLATYRFENSYRLKTYTFSYDQTTGQLLERREVTDYEKDGDIDDTDIDRYTYDDEGRLTSIEYIDLYPNLSGEDRYSDLTTFVYDEKGRLTEWIYEDSRNEVVDERSVVSVAYDAAEDSAQGTIIEWELIDGTLSPSEPQDIFMSFAAGAPTATLDLAVETSAYENFGAFKETIVTVPLPALYGIGYGALAVGL